jgi:hypothetical protein
MEEKKSNFSVKLNPGKGGDNMPMKGFYIAVTVDGIEERYEPMVAVEDISALIARWGYILAAWQHEHAVKDAAYRTWKAKQKKAMLDADPKVAEWKATVEVEAKTDWANFKDSLATAEQNVSLCWAVLEALRVRARNTQEGGDAKGAPVAPSAPAPSDSTQGKPERKRKAV